MYSRRARLKVAESCAFCTLAPPAPPVAAGRGSAGSAGSAGSPASPASAARTVLASVGNTESQNADWFGAVGAVQQPQIVAKPQEVHAAVHFPRTPRRHERKRDAGN